MPSLSSWMFRWSSRSLLSLLFLSIFLQNELANAEIKFIPVNRQVRNIAAGPSGGNLIDKSVEPMALESNTGPMAMPSSMPSIPTFRLSEDKNGSILEEIPSLRGNPVLQFLTLPIQKQRESEQRQEKAEDDNAEEISDEDDESEEEDQAGDDEKNPKAEDSSETAALNLNMLTRHRRRLMQMRNKILENIDMKPNGNSNYGQQNVISSLPSNSAELIDPLAQNGTEGDGNATTLRPPPDRIIYALPEQSFWTPESKRFVKPKRKRSKSRKSNKTGKKIKNLQEEDPDSEPDQDPFLPPSPSAKGPNLPVQLKQQTPETEENTTEEYEDDAFPEKTETTSTTTPVPVTNANASNHANASDNVTATSTESYKALAPGPLPGPQTESISLLNRMRGLEEENKERIKAEKKFHLGQCMRYCMDAIL